MYVNWSMAQFIRLAVNLQEGRNLDTPKVVCDRYVLGKKESSNSKPYLASGKCNVDLGEIYSNDKKFIKYARGSNSVAPRNELSGLLQGRRPA